MLISDFHLDTTVRALSFSALRAYYLLYTASWLQFEFSWLLEERNIWPWSTWTITIESCCCRMSYALETMFSILFLELHIFAKHIDQRTGAHKVKLPAGRVCASGHSRYLHLLRSSNLYHQDVCSILCLTHTIFAVFNEQWWCLDLRFGLLSC